MRKRKLVPLAVLCALLPVGCLKEDFSEKEIQFEIDAPSLDLLSGSEITEATISASEYPESVGKIISISSNTSWKVRTASDKPEADLSWISLSEEKHLNLSGAVQNSSLLISASRNKTAAAREADLVFTRPDGSTLKYLITQQPTVPDSRKPVVYAANGKLKDIDHIRGNAPDTCYIKVICNTAWRASLIRKETTANATLMQTSGTDDAVITLKFKAITTSDTEKTAALAISPTGCKPDTIRFTQVK